MMNAHERFPPGSVLGSYEICELLGAGGMGQVYRAQDRRLGRSVALKVLPPEVAGDAEGLSRFEREARAASALNHVNIVTIHEFDRAGDVPFLVMEWLEGETLRQRLERGALSPALTLDVATQIADGLAKAHEAGIVHRDLKPDNLMLTKDGPVKILDFGIAKLLPTEPAATSAATQTAPLTSRGAVVGTAAYMSPEQAKGDRLDHRSDQFSLGATMYEMVTGRRAFEGASLAETLAAILDREPPPLRSLAPEAPARLAGIVEKCLSKDPEGRYASTRDLAADLRRLRDASEGRVTVTARAVGAGRAGGVRPRRGWLLGAAGVVAVAAAVAVLVSKRPTRGQAIRSLAVVPFLNESGDADLDYAADGITDSLITSFSRIPEVAVQARSSVVRYKTDVDPRAIGRDLNVDGVMTGRVAHRESGLSVAVELVQARDGRLIWSQRYENRKASDLLALQEEIARDASDKLRLSVSGEMRRRLARRSTENPAAFEAYLKGRYFFNLRPRDTSKAIDFFQLAIDRDPAFASAYAGLAECWVTLGAWENGTRAPRDAFPKGKSVALKALEIDDDLGEAHAPLGYAALHFDWDAALAEREFQRALQLSPRYAQAHHWYAHYLAATGRREEALAEGLRTKELEPLDPVLGIHNAWHHQMFRDYDKAIEVAAEVAELGPTQPWPPYFFGLAYEQKGDHARAIAELRRSVDLSKGSTVMISALGHAYASAGRQAEARKVLADLTALAERRYVSSYEIGLIHLALGERDEGFRYLEKSFEERSAWLVYLPLEPRLDPFRSDPRLADLIRRVGLRR
jgi:eukaryotic-like serine/threonine-protein kinase